MIASSLDEWKYKKNSEGALLILQPPPRECLCRGTRNHPSPQTQIYPPHLQERTIMNSDENSGDKSQAIKTGEPGKVEGVRAIRYTTLDGQTLYRVGGGRGWRNHNPGNITRSPFAERHGSIGCDGARAIFPDNTTGENAHKALLKTGESPKSAPSGNAPAATRSTSSGAAQPHRPPHYAPAGKETLERKRDRVYRIEPMDKPAAPFTANDRAPLALCERLFYS